jgi:predicted nucleotide-binding protein
MTFDDFTQETLDQINQSLSSRFNWITNIEEPMTCSTGEYGRESPIHFDFSEQLITTLIVVVWANLLSGILLKWLDTFKRRIIRKAEVEKALEELGLWINIVLQHDGDVKTKHTNAVVDEIKNRLEIFTNEDDKERQSLLDDCLRALQMRLRYHGWPTDNIALSDAKNVLDIILRKVIRNLSTEHAAPGLTHIKTYSDGDRIFIGHGRAPYWKELKEFITDRLGLPWEEFNRESAAGFTTKERLEQMLDNAIFAFLILGAEDEDHDGTLHARLNVIHELGLFQGRLGFEKAIILLEDGCAEFSNIHGLTQIRFPKGNLRFAFEEIRMVLEREGVLSP